VALHELGHWLNLRDLYGDTGDGYDTAKVMYGISMMGTTKRYLHASDKAGVQWIYSSSSSCTTPFAPSNVNASDGTYCDKVEITWSYASGATGYEIWRATSSNPAYAAKLADDTASPYHDTSAAVGTTYYYWIKATSACGTSSFSAPNTGYRSSTANPPSSVNATDGTYCDYIQVSWSSVPGATAYEIWRSTGSSSASAVHIADDTSSPYDDTSAVTGTTYYYWVKTQSTCGTSGFSTFNTGYCADTPAPPANVVASDGTYCDNVHITWDAVLGATAYEIWRSTGSSSASAVKIADDTSSPYDDTSAVTGTTYYYWIKAKNTCDTSLFSNPDSGYRPAQTTPPAPTGVSATDGICDKIQLRWDPVPNAVGYEIWQGTSSNSVFAAKIADVTVTSYNHYSATPGMTYYYWVKTKNACSTSPFSDGDTGYRAGAPAAPTYVSASDGTSTQSIRINWNTVSGATGYEIWRGTSDNPPLAVKIADDTAPPYSDYSAVGGTLYYYWIKARNVCGVSDFSDSNTGYFIEYSLVLSSSAGGSIANPGEGTLRYAPGTSITIQAAPDVGYRFGSWTGTAVDTGNVADPNASEITITVNSDYSLKAVFLSLLDEIHVDDNAPLDPAPHTSLVSDPHENGTPEHPYDSLQKAIEVAAEGSRVVIGSGTYAGPLDLMGKAIEVTGADPNNPDISAWPVIDAQGMEPVVSFTQGEDPNTILRGLVLTGGVGQKAGAINCINSSPFITNCLIVGNRTMDTNGGAVYCQNSNAVLTNCTIAHNYSGPGGAGLYVVDSQVIVLNSIIWGNQAHQILAPLGPLPLVYYSDIEGGWSGTGNLDLDPLFVLPGYWADVTDPAIWVDPSDPRAFWVNDGDYHLKPQSPCIDAGDPNLPVGAEPEPNGGLINMGAYGGTSQATLSGD
jgi:fibronectin type 3 domain-containing protein